MPAFWGYPPPPHDYPYHWIIIFNPLPAHIPRLHVVWLPLRWLSLQHTSHACVLCDFHSGGSVCSTHLTPACCVTSTQVAQSAAHIPSCLFCDFHSCGSVCSTHPTPACCVTSTQVAQSAAHIPRLHVVWLSLMWLSLQHTSHAWMLCDFHSGGSVCSTHPTPACCVTSTQVAQSAAHIPRLRVVWLPLRWLSLQHTSHACVLCDFHSGGSVCSTHPTPACCVTSTQVA